MRRMTGMLAVGVASAAMLLVAGCAHQAMDAQAVLRDADRAMGGAQVKSLRYAGAGTGATFGQAYVPGQAWPRLNLSMTRVVDYESGALREDGARSRAEPNGGGAVPLMGLGEQRTIGLLRGTHAWNLVGPAPVAAPLTVDARIHDLWTTPHGVLKAAMRNGATARKEDGKTVLRFTEPGRFRAAVWIGADGLVERVDSVLPNAVMGDTETSTLYSGYRDHGGAKFPARIQQTQGGYPVLDLNVTEVQLNAALAVEVPALVTAFAERVVAERAAEGVWYLAGGSHHSVLIEMADHLILIESPLYDGRSLAVLAEAKKLVPGKPIRYAVNSHHHFDHAGGLRTAASDGVTLVTSELSRPWYEKAFANPNSINPDALQRSGRKANVIGVSGMRDIGTPARPVIVYAIESSVHAQGFNMVWLPRERLLIQADAYTPGAAGSAPPSPPNANNVNLLANIERLKLDVDRILPLHGRMVALTDLRAAVGAR